MTEELFREDAYLRECEATVIAAGPEGIELDRTVFYPMGGGQPGDRGTLYPASGGELAVVDTRHGPEAGRILHRLEEGAALPAPGERMRAVIDWPRRYRLMRMHSTLHLLCAAVDAGVTGGSIGEDRGRLDFDLPDAAPDKEALTAELNRLIAADHPVTHRWVSDAELDARPELVRTLSVQPPRGQGRVRLVEVAGVDLQPCGGTHVAHTAEIGRVRVAKIEKKGRANRRISVVFDA